MYNVEIYAQSDINDAMSADALIPIEVKSTEDVVESILIPSSTINSINYFRISASNFSSGICVKSDYFYNLMLSGKLLFYQLQLLLTILIFQELLMKISI